MAPDQSDPASASGQRREKNGESAPVYVIPVVPHLVLRFFLRILQSAQLPAFKGSMLRGAFGHALRRTVCVMGPQQPCETCMLRRQCVHTRLFETFIEGEPPRFLRGLPTSPRPYVFEPFDMKEVYQTGVLLQFDLILLGQTIDLHPYAIFAVSQMAETGLGYRRVPCRLERVDWLLRSRGEEVQGSEGEGVQEDEGEWRLLYEGASKRLVENPVPQIAASLSLNQSGPANLQLANLHFLTPTRLKFDNDLSMDFTFRMLAFKMLRRVLELAHFHVPGAKVDWEFHDLLVAADQVEIVERNLRWLDWGRHSNRQKTDMKMGGFVGELKLRGNLAPFMELLRTCEVVHVGKGTVFGNGLVRVGGRPPRDESRG